MPVTVADNAVDRPLVDVVIDAIDADDDVSKRSSAAYWQLSKGRRHCKSYSTASRRNQETSSERTGEEPVGASELRPVWPCSLVLVPTPSSKGDIRRPRRLWFDL
ncbi:hypothetical protein CH294_18080 [Rhodococcus sp. 14-2483-1-1]|nr:hypothetical protein CH294_18080 [Rhodococcus sp. 14-2483-1-1]